MFDLEMPILVADDMEFMRRTIARTLRQIGFRTILEAQDGEGALAIISYAKPEVGLVISDWTMPKGSGIELLRHLRHDPRYAKLPFVFVTAKAEAHQVFEALQSGASDYIVKPFACEALAARLAMLHARGQG